MSKPISLQTYTIREIIKTPEAYRRAIERVAEIGYAGIEAGVPSHMTAEEFKRFLDDLGLRLSSSWCQPKPESVNRLIDLAGTFGFDCFVGCFGPDQFKTIEQTQKTADAFGAMAEALRPHGLRMCYHNHWWEFAYPDASALPAGRYGWDVLMERAPSLDAEIDCYWASNFGAVDVPAVIAKYRSRTPLLHVKDGPLVKDAANVAVGAGKMDTKACVAAADPGVLQWLIVELDKFDGDIMDAVRDSYTWLVENGLGHGRE